MYHPGCDNECVNLEACGDGQSPGGAATIVKSMKKQVVQCVQLGEVGGLSMKSPGGAAITERLLQPRFVVKGVQEPTNERVPESVKVRNVLQVHCIDLLGG
jgi:hypothetical protein